MASVKFDKNILAKLLGKHLSDAEITETLAQMGFPVDGIAGGVITADITPNRPDLYSVEGIARFIKSFLGIKTGLPEYSVNAPKMQFIIDKSVAKVRPYAVAAVARNIKMSEELIVSLVELQEKLHETVGRKRRKMAMGFYDLAKLTAPITYTTADPNKAKYLPLEQTSPMSLADVLENTPKGKEYGHILKDCKKYPIIHDASGKIMTFPPILGSEEVKLTPETNSLFIDVTGTSVHTVHECLRIFCCALADQGATIEAVEVIDGSKKTITPDFSPLQTKVKLSDVCKIIGREFTAAQAKELLEKMGHSASVSGKLILVNSPCYRCDILHSIDIVEDVAIAFGYNNLEPTLPKFTSIANPSMREAHSSKVQEIMLGLGFTEVINWYITNKELNFSKMGIPEKQVVEITNPLTEQFTMVRTWAVPSLLNIFANNTNATMPQAIFEIGTVAAIEKEKHKEMRHLATAYCGPLASFSLAKSHAEAVLHELGWNFTFSQLENHASFIPGRAAQISKDGKAIGFFGEIHPSVLNKFGIEQPVFVMEISLD